MFPTRSELLDELELAIQGSSAEKRLQTLRRVTDLFLGGADRFSDEQIGVFDDVLVHLINKIEAKALIELRARLAPVDNASIEAIQRKERFVFGRCGKPACDRLRGDALFL